MRFVLFILFITLNICSFSQEQNENLLYIQDNFSFPYNINKPDEIIKLPDDLEEVSGISHLKDDIFACIQDEKGKIFFVDINSGDIINKVRFEENEDYEDIEVIGEDAWILSSKGNLYYMKNCFKDSDKGAKKYKTDLTSKNDCEGLTYNPTDTSLLIACKGYPYLDKHENKKDSDHFRAIYRFDIEKKELGDEPEYLINLELIKKYLDYGYMEKIGIELLSVFDRTKGDVSFQPSGIYLDSTNRDMWLISSVGKLLLILDEDGVVKMIHRLPKKHHLQPEGICVDDKGNLYIANEGRNNKGRIYKYRIKNEE